MHQYIIYCRSYLSMDAGSLSLVAELHSTDEAGGAPGEKLANATLTARLVQFDAFRPSSFPAGKFQTPLQYSGPTRTTARPYYGSTRNTARPYYGSTTTTARPYYGSTRTTARPYYRRGYGRGYGRYYGSTRENKENWAVEGCILVRMAARVR